MDCETGKLYSSRDSALLAGAKDYNLKMVDPKNISPANIARGRIGRNDPCTCGSGKKAKRCCLAPAKSNTCLIHIPATILYPGDVCPVCKKMTLLLNLINAMQERLSSLGTPGKQQCEQAIDTMLRCAGQSDLKKTEQQR